MNNIIDAKNAAEKLSLRELRAFRSWISDRIGQVERAQAKTEKKTEISPEQIKELNKLITRVKSVIISLLFISLFSSCTKDLTLQKSPEAGVKMIDWIVDPDGLVAASWEYPDGRIGGTDFTDDINVPYLIDEQRNWPECTNNECAQVTQQGECWRHKPIPELINYSVCLSRKSLLKKMRLWLNIAVRNQPKTQTYV